MVQGIATMMYNLFIFISLCVLFIYIFSRPIKVVEFLTSEKKRYYSFYIFSNNFKYTNNACIKICIYNKRNKDKY